MDVLVYMYLKPFTTIPFRKVLITLIRSDGPKAFTAIPFRKVLITRMQV